MLGFRPACCCAASMANLCLRRPTCQPRAAGQAAHDKGCLLHGEPAPCGGGLGCRAGATITLRICWPVLGIDFMSICRAQTGLSHVHENVSRQKHDVGLLNAADATAKHG